jgi:hypothetical protein
MRLADKPGVMLRRITPWAAPLLLLITVYLVPVTNSKMKLFQVGLLMVTVVSWLTALRPKMRLLVIAAIMMVAGLFCLPARDAASHEMLAAAHARAMLRYQGSTYWWGGENALGIDCSGLIRRGAIDALMREGLVNLDGGLLRAASDLWWHDTSAEALGEGYRGYTLPVTKAKSLNELDHALVEPGDMAIAGGGAHILAYLGDKQWIQADPSANKVIVETAPSTNGWFKGAIQVVRWRWVADLK